MRLVVLGASGKTGQELVKLAVTQGHAVTAVTRNPETFSHMREVKAVKANVFDSNELAKVFAGQDAVLSTLGNNNSKLRLIERSSSAIVEAMEKTGVKRLIVELSFAAAKDASLTTFVKFVMDTMLGKMLKDQAKGVEIIKASNLDWTILYAAILTDGPLTKQVRVVDSSEKISLKHKISRADVSYAMLKITPDKRQFKKSPVITAA